ncbi:MAG: hypothetical protein GC160_27760 [Acidobacteria bacterium]|nr:hypothetical protein [Acidobacteriota bacterium]
MRELAAAAAFVWDSTRGARLSPWKSPYLRWRIETYWGLPAASIQRETFWAFSWRERRRLLSFLLWAGRMRSAAR